MTAERDLSNAWSCAANLRLYDDDRRTNVGSITEPRWVDRREALTELYARQMLMHGEGELDRLTSAAQECRRLADEQRRLRGGCRAPAKSR